ncbi:MAG: hypothetical protein CO186_07070 [Zetaproteobacteria bacterium CG_4_9_14_3_um_filter_49_83]|nr:MAG: hypothetical protein AUJ56_04930 [Zetaproteobacteria bacterium CG1_02_49_23]PIQ33925.1 MAG: hypothetical protein COW62_03785 [Zetaproteobacteria bacterium CG17_big_fil_post_rev_8_21_14_2_50_50_13]PIV30166.1 MAG: hypothetical protein COS35_08070 [Zetaproteobacteria bacterium CG02_land_8_20_14_3_00_50_9]PIY54856.1 MAG: hypothetical protein COZ00_12490 [Zetaproteobacteria bacterium CG_4_10_14_0_8_um_filter_49_80]PJA35218.1 MAG: hypothetical protein CO186_07070 [Zetaproteobacteria bacterium
MPILFRWIFYSCLYRTIATMAALIAIFAIIEVFDKSRYLGHGMTGSLIVEYILLKTPMMVTELMPVMLLVAISIYISEISHHHEAAALKASGLGLKRILLPALLIGFLGGILSFILGEFVTPVTNTRLDSIERTHIHHKQDVVTGTQWLKDENRFYRIKPLTSGVFSMIVLETNNQGLWSKRMDAAKAIYKNDTWLLYDVYLSQPDTKEGMQLTHTDTAFIPSDIGPETADPPSPKHMNFEQLFSYADSLQRAGLEAGGYIFELHRKIASLLTCLVMVILAIALCLNLGSRIAATSWGLIGALTLGMSFYVLGNASSLLIHGNQLSPAYAAWLPLLSFGGFSMFLLLHREGKI